MRLIRRTTAIVLVGAMMTLVGSGVLPSDPSTSDADTVVAVRALAPDLIDFLVDGSTGALGPTGNVNPDNGIDIGELLVADQGVGNKNFFPEVADATSFDLDDDQINVGQGADLPNLKRSLAMIGYLGSGATPVTFTATPGNGLIAESLPAGGSAPGPLAVCGSLPLYLGGIVDIPDGDCDGVDHGAPGAIQGAPGTVNFILVTVAPMTAVQTHICLQTHGNLLPGNIITVNDGTGELMAITGIVGVDAFCGGPGGGYRFNVARAVAPPFTAFAHAALKPVIKIVGVTPEFPAITALEPPGTCFSAVPNPYSAGGGIVDPYINDVLCQEDGIAIMHLVSPSAITPPPTTITASVSQGNTVGVAYRVVGSPATTAVLVQPNTSGDPLKEGDSAIIASPRCPGQGPSFTQFDVAALATTQSFAFVAPVDAVGNLLTRIPIGWSSNLPTRANVALSLFMSIEDPLTTARGMPNLICSGVRGSAAFSPAIIGAQPLAVLMGAPYIGGPVGSPGVMSVNILPAYVMSIDADPTNGTGACSPVDASRTVMAGTGFDVAVCINNAPDSPGAFVYSVVYDDTVISGVDGVIAPPALDANPDANEGSTTFSSPDLGTLWDCSGGSFAPPRADNIVATGPGNGRSFSGACTDIINSGTATLGTSGPLGMIHYTAGPLIDSTTLELSNVQTGDSTGANMGVCNPGPNVFQPTLLFCDGATINVTGPGINKDVDPDTPGIQTEANLFLCEGPTCATYGNGAGMLTVDEVATGVFFDPLGVGAFEFQLKFDHKIFQVDIDETPWLSNGGTRNVTCNLTVVTENYQIFGCVSEDPTPGNPVPPGPTVDGVAAKVKLTPQADLKFRIRPGNDNGVKRTILDENCELTNIFGEPIQGNIAGGLAQECGDATITVRILEGDLDLDCDVDVNDAQAIAYRFGAFFGMLNYDPWFDLEPAISDFDVDIKDLQKVFGRDGSTCDVPIPPQPPQLP